MPRRARLKVSGSGKENRAAPGQPAAERKVLRMQEGRAGAQGLERSTVSKARPPLSVRFDLLLNGSRGRCE